jgi:16S rRNA processing protein RimM
VPRAASASTSCRSKTKRSKPKPNTPATPNRRPAATTPPDANAGRIAGVFGLRGDLKVAANRIGEDALVAGIDVRATLTDGTVRTLRIASIRRHKDRPLVHFAGVDDANAAAALVGSTLAIERSAVVLRRDEYLDDDLIGCAVIDTNGTTRGAVVGVEHYPAQDVLLVGDARAMLPMVRAFIRTIDIGARRIVVDVPPGLLDPEQAEEA